MDHRELSEQYTTWGYSKLLQHTDVLYDIQNKREFRPIQLQLCPTEICDSDCPFCAVGYRPMTHMPWDKAEKCVRDFKKLGIKSLEITGGGNPMLYRDGKKNINDLIALAVELELDIGIITNSENLSKLDPSFFDKITWLRVSLAKLDEGKTPEDYNFCGFPEEKLGFSYIVHDKGEGCRTKRQYSGTTEDTFNRIAELVNLHPKIKFVRIAGNALICGYNGQTRERFKEFVKKIDVHSKFFIKDIGENDFPYDRGCYVGMIRPFIASSPKKDGKYYAYMCNSHVLFCGQTYNLDYALCEVEDVIPTWERLNKHYLEHGYPYEVRCNKGKNWKNTCKLCFYQPNNELLHAVATEVPDKNFP